MEGHLKLLEIFLHYFLKELKIPQLASKQLQE